MEEKRKEVESGPLRGSKIVHGLGAAGATRAGSTEHGPTDLGACPTIFLNKIADFENFSPRPLQKVLAFKNTKCATLHALA
jgi:hypothetical protein